MVGMSRQQGMEEGWAVRDGEADGEAMRLRLQSRVLEAKVLGMLVAGRVVLAVSDRFGGTSKLSTEMRAVREQVD